MCAELGHQDVDKFRCCIPGYEFVIKHLATVGAQRRLQGAKQGYVRDTVVPKRDDDARGCGTMVTGGLGTIVRGIEGMLAHWF